jgi:hypothetical protein
MNKYVTKKRFENLDLTAMKNAGFNLIAYSVMMCEDTFYFETENEAEKAFQYFEGGPNATREYSGWWYCVDDIEKNIKDYKKEIGYKPEIIYFKNE